MVCPPNTRHLLSEKQGCISDKKVAMARHKGCYPKGSLLLRSRPRPGQPYPHALPLHCFERKRPYYFFQILQAGLPLPKGPFRIFFLRWLINHICCHPQPLCLTPSPPCLVRRSRMVDRSRFGSAGPPEVASTEGAQPRRGCCRSVVRQERRSRSHRRCLREA